MTSTTVVNHSFIRSQNDVCNRLVVVTCKEMPHIALGINPVYFLRSQLTHPVLCAMHEIWEKNPLSGENLYGLVCFEIHMVLLTDKTDCNVTINIVRFRVEIEKRKRVDTWKSDKNRKCSSAARERESLSCGGTYHTIFFSIPFNLFNARSGTHKYTSNTLAHMLRNLHKHSLFASSFIVFLLW